VARRLLILARVAKAKLVVNPASGADRAPELLPRINERLRARFDTLDIGLTVAAGDAAALARSAVEDGYDHVLAVGGDGTLNEVVNGVAQLAHGLDAVTLGVLPLGTGNDFATALGIPGSLEAALDALLVAEPAAVDLGVVNGVHFINVSAGGFIAEVSDAVTPQLKTVAGRLAYLIGGAQVLLDYEPIRADVRAPGVILPAQTTLHAFAVCNSRLVGGGRLIAPDALIDDGLLDVCLIEAMPTMEFLALLRRVASGEHVEDPRVIYFRTEWLELAFGGAVKVNTDGEVLESDRLRYEVRPGAARVLANRSEAATLRAIGSQAPQTI
jgi:diacylglycerol kinase (ATP)